MTKVKRKYIMKFLVTVIFLLVLWGGWEFTQKILAKPENWILITENEITSDESQGGIFQPFLFDENKVFFTNDQGYVYAFDKLSGKKIWQFRTNRYVRHGLNSSDDKLLIFTDFDGRVYALDKNSGQEVWRFATPGLIMPDTAAYVKGNLVYFGSRNGKLYALDKQTGEKKWEFATKPISDDKIKVGEAIIHFGHLVLDKDKVYINSANDNTIYALNRVSGEKIWEFKNHKYYYGRSLLGSDVIVIKSADKYYYCLDKSSGELRWKRFSDGFHSEKITDDSFYYKNGKGNFYKLDLRTGKELWKLKEDDIYLQKNFVVNDLIFLSNVNSSREEEFVAVNKNSGEIAWDYLSNGEIRASPVEENGSIYFNVNGSLKSFDSDSGKENWSFPGLGTVKEIRVGSNGVYSVNKVANGNLIVYFINKSTGEIRWYSQISDQELLKVFLNEEDLYIYSKQWQYEDSLPKPDMFSIYKFGGSQKNRKVYLSHKKAKRLSKLSQNKSGIKNKLLSYYRVLASGEYRKTKLTQNEKSLKEEGIFELRLAHTDKYYNRPEMAVKLIGYLTSPDGEKYKIKGFYVDKNRWKLRFRPNKVGEWKWKVKLRTPFIRKKFEGTFDFGGHENIPFLKTSSRDSRFLYLGENKRFYGLGIQNTLSDLNHNGAYLDQLTAGFDSQPPKNPEYVRYLSLDEYLKEFGPEGAGFNLFRWSVANYSRKLWRELSAGNFSVDINHGIWGDELVKQLRDNGFHIWMTIFGFDTPLKDSINKKQSRRAVKSYLDYVVARYGPYVDIWEIANEDTLTEDFIKFVSEYIRKIDPYHHPITVSWQRPDLKSIDINSLHYYLEEPPQTSDLVIANLIKDAKKWNKPVIFSEIGFKKKNWSPNSAMKLRIYNWVSFFNNALLIYWNSSDQYILAEEGNANVYFGPIERRQTKVFRDVVDNLESNLEIANLDVENPEIRVYAMESEAEFIAYFYHFKNQDRIINAKFAKNFEGNGVIEWISPRTGEVLRKGNVIAGKNEVVSPEFSEDIVLRVEFE